MTLDLGVLGPLEVRRAGRLLDLGAPKQRAVLARLLLSRGRVVSAEALVDAVWGEQPPPSALPSLQVYVSNLRRLLRDESGVSPLVRRSPGYLLEPAGLSVDLDTFRVHLDAAVAALDAADWPAVVAAAREAVGCWRGEVLADLRPADWLEPEALVLDDQWAQASRLLVTGLLGTGESAEAVSVAQSLAARLPFRDDVARLRALALHRDGRTPDALEELRLHAARLDDELGLEPSSEVRELQTALLRQEEWASRWPLSGGTTDAAERTAVTAVTASVPEPRTATGGTLPAQDGSFIGREPQLEVAEQAIAQALAGVPTWLVLTGPAGIGKTRLAEEILVRAGSDALVVRARCLEEAGAPAWWPLRQVVVGLGGDPEQVLQVPSGAEADSARFTVYQRIQELLEGTAAERPVAILVDDLQWADETSLRALSYLAGSMTSGRLLIVATVRDAEGGPRSRRTAADVLRLARARHVVVPPLSAEDVVALATAVAGEDLDAGEARDLADRTGGNALFVTEYARLSAAERREGEVPLAVRGVLGRRLDSLDAGVLQVLRVAAVIGDVLDLDLLARVSRTDIDDLLDLLDDAVDEQIVVARADGRGYAFSHALLRDEVLAGMSPIRRQQVHQRVADALATGGGERVTRRAQHLLAAGPLADARELLEACRAAALLAEERWSAETAVGWWRRARDAFDVLPADEQDPQERDDLVVAEVEALVRSGQGSTVIEMVDAEVTEALRRERPETIGRLSAALLRSFGTWPWVAFTSPESSILLAHRLADLEPFVATDPAAAARTMAAAAVGLCYDSDIGRFDDLSARALALAETTGDPDVLADALLGRILPYIGVVDRAADSDRLLQRLLSLPRTRADADRAIAHSARVMTLASLGDVTGAEEQMRLGIAACDRLRLPVVRVQLRWSEVKIAEWRLGPRAAESKLAEAAASHARVDLYDVGYVHTASTALHWLEGRLDVDGSSHGYMEPLVWDAALAAERGDVALADRLVADRLAAPDPWIWATHGHLVVLAHTVADLGLTAHAEALLPLVGRGRGQLSILGQGQILGPTDLALARLHDLLGHDDEARTLAAAARELSLRNGNARWVAHCEELTGPHTATVRAAIAAARA